MIIELWYLLKRHIRHEKKTNEAERFLIVGKIFHEIFLIISIKVKKKNIL